MKRMVAAIGVSTAMVLTLSAGAVATNAESNGNQGAVWAQHCQDPFEDPTDGCVSGFLDSGQEWSDDVTTWSKTEHKGGVSEGVHLFKGNGPKDM